LAEPSKVSLVSIRKALAWSSIATLQGVLGETFSPVRDSSPEILSRFGFRTFSTTWITVKSQLGFMGILGVLGAREALVVLRGASLPFEVRVPELLAR
jgi:hypothetical protein